MDKNQKTPTQSDVNMTELVLPQHTNPIGTVFGGVVLSWVDIAAAIAAQRHCNHVVVTASIDAMNFVAPVKLGWIVNIKARVNFVHRSSCEVGVNISAESPIEGKIYRTATAYVTMVAVDDEGRPVPMTSLTLITDEDQRRFDEAKKRRAYRLQLRKTN